MKKNSFKSAFSELYLISPVVYKAVIENIKKSGGSELQDLEKLNKSFLTDGRDKSVLEQTTDSPIQTQVSNAENTGIQESPGISSVEMQTKPTPINNSTFSQTLPVIDEISEATQTSQDQNNRMTLTNQNQNSQMTQTNQNQNFQSTQTTPLNVSSVGSQTFFNPEMKSTAVQTTQPNNIANSTQTTQTPTSSTPPTPLTPPTPPSPQASLATSTVSGPPPAQISLEQNSKKTYQCDQCSAKFTRLFSKQRHAKNIHGITEKKSNRKRKATTDDSPLPKKQQKLKKPPKKLESRIPRPENGIIALAKNKSAVKRPTPKGKSKIPRLIKRNIFKDETFQRDNAKVKRKISNEPLELQKPNRGLKRKKNDDLKNPSKKIKFGLWK